MCAKFITADAAWVNQANENNARLPTHLERANVMPIWRIALELDVNEWRSPLLAGATFMCATNYSAALMHIWNLKGVGIWDYRRRWRIKYSNIWVGNICITDVDDIELVIISMLSSHMQLYKTEFWKWWYFSLTSCGGNSKLINVATYPHHRGPI